MATLTPQTAPGIYQQVSNRISQGIANQMSAAIYGGSAYPVSTAVTNTAYWSSNSITTGTSPTTASSTMVTMYTGGGVATNTVGIDPAWDRHPDDRLMLEKKQVATRRPLTIAELNAWASYVPPDLTKPAVRTVHGFIIQEGYRYVMPDGALIEVDDRGNYFIEDADAKVIYKANRVREFNPFLNASDLMEKFITEVGAFDGVNQDEVLRLPVEAFIHWLILQAAKRDGDSIDGLPTVEAALPKPPPVPALPAPARPVRGRCLACGRFLLERLAAAQVRFCNPEHFQRHFAMLTHSPQP